MRKVLDTVWEIPTSFKDGMRVTVWEETLEDAFRAAADATLNVMVEELDSVQPKERRELRLESPQLDLLLFNFLQEIIYYKDAETLLLQVPQVEIHEEPNRFILQALARGKVGSDTPPPTGRCESRPLHRFRLEKTARGWEALVILGI